MGSNYPLSVPFCQRHNHLSILMAHRLWCAMANKSLGCYEWPTRLVYVGEEMRVIWARKGDQSWWSHKVVGPTSERRSSIGLADARGPFSTEEEAVRDAIEHMMLPMGSDSLAEPNNECRA